MSRADKLEVGILQPARDTDLGGDAKCYARAESLLREDDWDAQALGEPGSQTQVVSTFQKVRSCAG